MPSFILTGPPLHPKVRARRLPRDLCARLGGHPWSVICCVDSEIKRIWARPIEILPRVTPKHCDTKNEVHHAPTSRCAIIKVAAAAAVLPTVVSSVRAADMERRLGRGGPVVPAVGFGCHKSELNL